MLSPIQNITFNKIYKNNKKPKANTQNIAKQNAIKYSNAYPVPFLGTDSFFTTLDKNYFQLPKVTFEDGSYYQLRPDECQLECAKKLYKGDSVVFCAPTGTGKTAVANYIMTKNLNENKKTIYTTPLKALANDKLREFRKIYGEENVGLLTGDIKLNTNAPIQIMTCEVYNNQTLQLSKNPKGIATVIFDEAHYIGDKERGNVWENSIINTPPNDIQILCLSATIGNSNEFSSLIQKLNPSREVSKIELKSENRHVPLLWYLYDTKENNFKPIIKKQVNLNEIDVENLTPRQKRAFEIIFKAKNNINSYYELTQEEYTQSANEFIKENQNLLNENMPTSVFEDRLRVKYPSLDKNQIREITQFLSNEDTKKVDLIHTPHKDDDYLTLITSLKQQKMLPSLIFKLSKTECFKIAMKLKEEKLDLTTQEEKEQIEQIINEYKKDMYLGNSFDKDMLLNGFAYHNADMLPQYRKLIEELFSKKLLKTVIATSTLSAGINMPARSVVISDTFFKKYNPKTKEIESTPLNANDFYQMAGRAGRRGIDSLGYVILYNLDTPQKGFKHQILLKKQRGEEVKTAKNFDKFPDELFYAYELLESSANPVLSHYKPDWCLLAKYIEENKTNDNLKTIIDSSFKIHCAKDSQKEANKLLNQFHNYETVLLKNGFIEKNNRGEMELTPKGKILKMSQGLNPLMLASLIYDEKLDGIMMENLCQIIAYIAGSDNQGESLGMDDLLEDQLMLQFGRDFWEEQLQEEYKKTQNIFLEAQTPVLRAQMEGRVSPANLTIADSISGYMGFLFGYLNATNPNGSVENFRKITGSTPSIDLHSENAFKDLSPSKKEFIRKTREGHVYNVLAKTISTMKQIQKICDFALSNSNLYPNQEYYSNLKENAIIATELLEKIPFNDELSV